MIQRQLAQSRTERPCSPYRSQTRRDMSECVTVKFQLGAGVRSYGGHQEGANGRIVCKFIGQAGLCEVDNTRTDAHTMQKTWENESGGISDLATLWLSQLPWSWRSGRGRLWLWIICTALRLRRIKDNTAGDLHLKISNNYSGTTSAQAVCTMNQLKTTELKVPAALSSFFSTCLQNSRKEDKYWYCDTCAYYTVILRCDSFRQAVGTYDGHESQK